MPDELMTIDLSGLGGLAPRKVGIFTEHESRVLIYLGAENQFADGVVNPICRLGYLSPSTAGVVDASVGTSLALIGSCAADSNATSMSIYFLERGTKIWERTRVSGTYYFKNKNTIAGTTGLDLAWYTINDARRLFYAFKNADTTAGIGTYNPTTDTWYNNWSYELAAGTSIEFGFNDLRMEVADNGFMYVLDGSSLHKIDGNTSGGANGTISADVLQWPATFKLIDLVDSNGYLWIALLQTPDASDVAVPTEWADRKGGVYVWDRASTISNSTDFVPIDGIKDIKSLHLFQGTIVCFTISTSNKVQLRMYNGKEFQVIEELGYQEYPVYHDSVDSAGDRLVWQAYSGKFWSWGKITSSGSNIIIKLGDMNKPSILGAGKNWGGAGAMIAQNASAGGGEMYHISLQNNSYPLLIKWAPHGYMAEYSGARGGIADSDYFSLVKRLPKLSTLKEITVFCPSETLVVGISEGTELMHCNIYVNNASTTIKSDIFTGKDRRLGYKRIPIAQADVNCFQIGFGWNEDLNFTQIPTPSHAEVIYEPKLKKK